MTPFGSRRKPYVNLFQILNHHLCGNGINSTNPSMALLDCEQPASASKQQTNEPVKKGGGLGRVTTYVSVNGREIGTNRLSLAVTCTPFFSWVPRTHMLLNQIAGGEENNEDS